MSSQIIIIKTLLGSDVKCPTDGWVLGHWEHYDDDSYKVVCDICAKVLFEYRIKP